MNAEQSLSKFRQGDICLANYSDDRIRPIIIIEVDSAPKRYKIVPLSSSARANHNSTNNLLLNIELNGKPNNIVVLCDRSTYLLETSLSIRVGNVDENVILQIKEFINGRRFCGAANHDISEQNVHIDLNQQLLLEKILHHIDNVDNGVSDLMSPSTAILNIFVSILVSLFVSSILIISKNSIKWAISISVLAFIITVIIIIYKKVYKNGQNIKGGKITSNDNFPYKFIISNPYKIRAHDQGNTSNCTSHAIATMVEYSLSEKFKQPVSVDYNDLWEKQKNMGQQKKDLAIP